MSRYDREQYNYFGWDDDDYSGWDNNESEVSERERREQAQYSALLAEARAQGLSCPYEVSRYIVANRLWNKYPKISGHLTFENSSRPMNGAIAPRWYAQLCQDLGFSRHTSTRPKEFSSYESLGYRRK